MITFDWGLTAGAKRPAFSHRNFQWHPIDNDIEKAADNNADDKDIEIKNELNQFNHRAVSFLYSYRCLSEFQFPNSSSS